MGLPSTQKFILHCFIKGRVIVFINMPRAPQIPLLVLHADVKQQHFIQDHANAYRPFPLDSSPLT